MKYMGSKDRIAKKILPIILNCDLNSDYVEPFVGGFNMIDKIPSFNRKRIANDKNNYLISLFSKLQNGWIPPKKVDRETYNLVKNNKDLYPPELVGYIGFCCSYSGKWFGGYAGETKTKQGLRDYQDEAFRNLMNQVQKIKDIELYSEDYFNFPIKNGSIIYCDPPYEGTTKYKDDFNHKDFWDWCRIMSKNNKVFISEYNAPEDFECILEINAKSSLSANGIYGGCKISTEKLFRFKC